MDLSFVAVVSPFAEVQWPGIHLICRAASRSSPQGRAVHGRSARRDPDVMRFTGSGAQAATYARRYGSTDVDGRVIEPFVLPDQYRLV
jgi:hypothetical protein